MMQVTGNKRASNDFLEHLKKVGDSRRSLLSFSFSFILVEKFAAGFGTFGFFISRFLAYLQNSWPLIYILLNKNSNYFYITHST